MQRILIGLLLAVSLITIGCRTTEETPSADGSTQPQLVDGMTGTVTYMDLEGGFYGILGDDGEKYFPLNLDPSYREDGLRVRFTVRERNDVMTTTMWGKTVELTAIERM